MSFIYIAALQGRGVTKNGLSLPNTKQREREREITGWVSIASFTFMHFFFKAEHKSQGYYVDCEWMNDVDFAVKDQNEAPICKVTVSDVNQFWSGTGTRKPSLLISNGCTKH